MIPCKRAIPDFLDMLDQTWKLQDSGQSKNILTEEEKRAFKDTVLFHTESRIFGTYAQRYKILNAIYTAYLIGIGKFDR